MTTHQCNCGFVSFEIAQEVREIIMCHCSVCRRYSGAQGVAVVIVPNRSFRWICGEEQVVTWKKPGEDWESSFCKTCGSALPGKDDAQHMYIPAGLLDSASGQLNVAHHIWVGSKAQWFEIADDAKQHLEAFDK